MIRFNYLPKKFMMNSSEYKFYKILCSFIDGLYSIIPQVHLDELVKPERGLKSRRIFSFRHINQKSVDFVICDKKSMCPLLAIELDDRSHEREDRKDRDEEVQRILRESNIELLRFKKEQSKEEIQNQISEKLNSIK